MGMRSGESRLEYNARMNAQMKAKYYERRAKAIEYLGGKCVDCGHSDVLEFDHESDKVFNLAARMNSAPWDILTKELYKCKLRCIACHEHMTAYRRLSKLNLLALESGA